MKTDELKLMIPGPIQPSAEVLKAMGSPVRPHYGPKWTAYYNETIEILKGLFGTQDTALLLVGSGSSGLDACIGSALTSGEKIVIGVNGHFGERLQEIAGGYDLNIVTVAEDWGKPLDPHRIAEALKEHRDARLLAFVQVETSTTIVNPVREISQVAHQHGIPVMVDAVSSLGALPMQMDAWGIDFCVSASQKCLGAPPGLAPVGVSRRGWELIDRNPRKGHGWYLNLAVWRRYAVEWGDWHPYPITMATNNIVALRTSLDDLLREGIEARARRYTGLALRLRAGLRRIGMPPFTPDEILCPCVTAAYGPPGVLTGEIVNYMEHEHRIKIAGGLGKGLKDKIFRIGHMSPVVNEGDIDQVIVALGQFPKNNLT